MGTHPNGPSRVVRDGKPAELLSELLEVLQRGILFVFTSLVPNCLPQKRPELLGGSDADLPYLFKVLSVNKALSIQVSVPMKLAGACLDALLTAFVVLEGTPGHFAGAGAPCELPGRIQGRKPQT